MKTINEIHAGHLDVKSEIAFLRQELNFFKKLLSKSYNRLTDNLKVKVLDAYWKEFEKYETELVNFNARVEQKEHELAVLCQKDPASGQLQYNEEDEISEYYGLLKGVRVLKESFYSYMTENSCDCKCH